MDDRYRIFPWIRRSTTVCFWGGPLHGEFREVQYLAPEFHVPIFEPLSIKDVISPAESVPYKVARYKLTSDGIPFGAVVYMNTVQKLYAYVFSGEI